MLCGGFGGGADENPAVAVGIAERRVLAPGRVLDARFGELDAEDEEQWLNIEYLCPNCCHEWQEQWSCACDSECPACGMKNITALSWDDAD